MYSPRIYIYKITFEEVPYYYYGVHKEKYFNEDYWGSPVTNKWCWELYTPKKQILEIYGISDEDWIKAQEVESRIIRQFYNTDKWCLNENCGGKISLSLLRESGKIYGKKGGKTAKERGVGIFSLSKEEMSKNSKKGIETQRIRKIGIFSLSKEKRIQNGNTTKERGVGIFSLSKEERRENADRGRETTKKLGTGIYAISSEQKSKQGKNTSKQKWKCLVTGMITNAGSLTNYQKSRGIDTSLRVRIE